MMNGGDITLIILCENSATLRLCGELISKNNQFTKSFNFFSPQRTGGAEMTAELMGYHFSRIPFNRNRLSSISFASIFSIMETMMFMGYFMALALLQVTLV